VRWPLRQPTLLVLATFGAVAAVAACNSLDCSLLECLPCPPALTVNVTNAADGGPVSNLGVVGMAGTCEASVCSLDVSTDGGPAGDYDFQLVAPGFTSLTVIQTIAAVEITGCCGCGYDFKTIDRSLTPE
jgi:hypothetical protein